MNIKTDTFVRCFDDHGFLVNVFLADKAYHRVAGQAEFDAF